MTDSGVADVWLHYQRAQQRMSTIQTIWCHSLSVTYREALRDIWSLTIARSMHIDEERIDSMLKITAVTASDLVNLTTPILLTDPVWMHRSPHGNTLQSLRYQCLPQ